MLKSSIYLSIWEAMEQCDGGVWVPDRKTALHRRSLCGLCGAWALGSTTQQMCRVRWRTRLQCHSRCLCCLPERQACGEGRSMPGLPWRNPLRRSRRAVHQVLGRQQLERRLEQLWRTPQNCVWGQSGLQRHQRPMWGVPCQQSACGGW